MSSDIKEVRAERLHRTLSAINLAEPDRVPVLGNIGRWLLSEKGYTQKDMMFDYAKIDLIVQKVLTEYDFDCFGAMVTWPGPAMQALGKSRGGYTFGYEKTTLQYVDTSFMEPGEYKKLICNPLDFIVNTILPRKFENLSRPAPYSTLAMEKSALLFYSYQDTLDSFYQKWSDDYGMVTLVRGTVRVPFDLIADYMRGFRGILKDLKNYEAEIEAACGAVLPLMVKWASVRLKEASQLPMIFLPLHTATFLGPKHFEQLYWPAFRSLVKAIMDEKKSCYLFFEGNWDTYLPYLVDLPVIPGRVIAHFETVNMKRAKELLGKKMCIAGNFPSDLLFLGSNAEIEDHVRRLLDIMAPGGGYIFAVNKGMVEAVPEKIRCMLDSVHYYGIY